MAENLLSHEAEPTWHTGECGCAPTPLSLVGDQLLFCLITTSERQLKKNRACARQMRLSIRSIFLYVPCKRRTVQRHRSRSSRSFFPFTIRIAFPS